MINTTKLKIKIIFIMKKARIIKIRKDKIDIENRIIVLPDSKLMPLSVADFGWNIYYIRAIWQRVD